MATESASTSSRPGKAGRTDYDQWNKVTNELVDDVEKEEKAEQEEEAKALGLQPGKYAKSQAEADEQQKLKEVTKAKKMLEKYQKRENAIKTEFVGILGPVPTDTPSEDAVDEKKQPEESKSDDAPKTIRITRNDLDAGKRVISVSDTSGNSQSDTIVLTQDLSLLESKMKANAMNKPKEYDGDADNGIKDPTTEGGEGAQYRTVCGVIKVFLSNLHNCTILLKCKIISGSIEVSHCSNVVIRVEKEATVATVQADLCEDITIEFRDAPSGKNTNIRGQPKIYWGEDKEDRIFHAGVKKMRVVITRDDYIETERMCDYIADGAKQIGNATPEEYQFVTSVVDGDVTTEAVVRAGQTTGENVRAMTQRELDAEKDKREQAAKMAVGMAENMIKFKEKGKEVTKSETAAVAPKVETPKVEEEEIMEVYGSMGKAEIDQIVAECDKNKTRGNEAFGAGEYAQAILLYSLALDKADELPDDPSDGEKQLFPRDVTLSNRAACFMKLGQHEKAEADAKRAMEINPKNIKALFRRGLSLHALARYQEAIPFLAEAQKIEPKNKQIKQALQFAEVRMTQEMRKRMAG